MSVRIVRAEYFLVKIPLRIRVEHALASRAASTSGFVVLADGNGHLGIGEFICRDYVTEEKSQDCLEYLNDLLRQIKDDQIEDPAKFIQQLWDTSSKRIGQQGALCAFELALLDLWGKQQGKAVAELLRPGVLQVERPVTYSAVYPFASGVKLTALNVLYRTVVRAESIKMKGNGRIAEDLDYVGGVRRAFGYPVDVRLDLNGSLSPGHAEEYFSRMAVSPAGVRWIEQPFPKNEWEKSAEFQQRFGKDLILCADESICSLEDLARAVTQGAFRAVNIRLAKNGGLLNSLRLYQKAIKSGLEAQLGCLVGESSVLSYAGLHFAALADQLRYHEGCFGKYLIKWDAIRPSLTFSRGGRVPFSRLPEAGLVPVFNVDRLRRQAYESGALGRS